MYDPEACVGGLLHAILPANPSGGLDQPAKYVDSGIRALIAELARLGADRKRLVVRVAGGANMLVAPGFSQALNIGSRNTETALATLSDLRLPVAGQEVGGNTGRTVRFYVVDGRMTIRTIGNQEREI
jgi:chemotaxis protein CheD